MIDILNKTDDKEFNQAIGEKIKALRKKNFLTQKRLGEKLGIKQSEISKLEKGDFRTTRISILKDIGELFNVSLDYLILGKDTNTLLDETKKIIQIKNNKTIYRENEAYSYPTIEINKKYFKYIFEISRANNTKVIPSDIRDSWIKKIEQEFIDSNNKKDFYLKDTTKVSYILVPKDILNLDTENQKDIMRNIQDYFDTLNLD